MNGRQKNHEQEAEEEEDEEVEGIKEDKWSF